MAPGVLWTNLTAYMSFARKLFLGKPPEVCDEIDPFHDWAPTESSRWTELRERRKARKAEKKAEKRAAAAEQSGIDGGGDDEMQLDSKEES
jgi:hypothetical protein